MNFLDIFFPSDKKDKDSPREKFDDDDVQKYFCTQPANNYIKKLLMSESKTYLTNADMAKLREAYDKAHDIRKFEIELYWKRTTYVWTLIAALITVSGVLLASYFRLNLTEETKKALLGAVAFVAVFGLFITIISQRILQSGEYWQKNWEYHVNLLEPLFSGKLYGTLLNTTQRRYSIAKLNNFLYRVVMIVWVLSAELIYRVVIDTSTLYSLIPFIAITAFIALVVVIIDRKTLRKTETAKIFLSQWDVSILDKNQVAHERKVTKELRKTKRISLVKNTLKAAAIIFLLCA